MVGLPEAPYRAVALLVEPLSSTALEARIVMMLAEAVVAEIRGLDAESSVALQSGREAGRRSEESEATGDRPGAARGLARRSPRHRSKMGSRHAGDPEAARGA